MLLVHSICSAPSHSNAVPNHAGRNSSFGRDVCSSSQFCLSVVDGKQLMPGPYLTQPPKSWKDNDEYPLQVDESHALTTSSLRRHQAKRRTNREQTPTGSAQVAPILIQSRRGPAVVREKCGCFNLGRPKLVMVIVREHRFSSKERHSGVPLLNSVPSQRDSNAKID